MKIISIILVVLFVGIQFIPVDRTNPPVTNKINWDTQETENLARRACYDCHSNETDWTWYSYVAPVSWFVSNHVNDGRKHLNFSTGNLDDAHEAAEEVEKGGMPLKSYLLLHGNASFSDEEKQAFIAGLKNTFGKPVRNQQNK